MSTPAPVKPNWVIALLLGIWTGFVAFVESVWKFVYDHFTDKSGFWDEKRTTAFALLCIAIWYGIFPAAGTHPDFGIFSTLLGAGVAQYFASAYNDGRGPKNGPGGQ